jgi:iron complex outermembrane receptor protein
MIRSLVFALGLLIFAIEARGQGASEQQREKEATARAQAIAIGGGPEALADAITAELADLGRYEDRVIAGTFGPALKNFPQETVKAFKRLDFEIQLNLLTYSWERFAFPAMAPVLIGLYQSPPDDSARVRDMALRRLYELDAPEARPLMLAELQHDDLRVSMTTLSQLPDAAFPEYETAWLRRLAQGVLDERIDAAVRIERFGSPAILADVMRIYREQSAGWSCDVRVASMAYILKHDQPAASIIIREAGPECRDSIEKHPALGGRPLEIEENVIVTATRTGGRIDDQPTRVEVLGREEVEEKMLMTPGDIVMMLNEMGGMRVQATSPSLGAATVRIQGMRGRYTRVLFDGLPLAGQQVGGLGLLQIPPMDLSQVEVIKGVASALYGAGAMGGVINMVARRAGDDPVSEVLLNQSTVGTTDGVGFFTRRLTERLRGTLLVGTHHQSKNDIDDDGWYDLAGYSRLIVRPRLFWEDGNSRSGWLTVGVTSENRYGGAVSAALPPQLEGEDYREAIDTTRVDVGGSYQEIFRGTWIFNGRVAATLQRHDHVFGPVTERDRHANVFAEASLRGVRGRHSWVGGVAFERESLDPIDVPRFEYFHRVPGLFAQDDIRFLDWLTLSASARLDLHHTYGTFFSPRASALVRWNGWTSRVSAGTGYFASTPLTEETEAAGLSRLSMPAPLEAETGRSYSIDVTRVVGLVSVTGTLFGSSVDHAIEVERESAYEITNADLSATNIGIELLATLRKPPYALTGTYSFVRSREQDGDVIAETPLTPKHSLGAVGMWEQDPWRVGIEYYFTGAQRLEANPYRSRSEDYSIVGMLAERTFGRFKVFLNAENITGVRQTSFDPLVLPAQAIDGRWTVDAWAPLDGRTFNFGIRAAF